MVEDELKDIQPEVDAAKELVGKLNSQNINEIKAYQMPPDAVSDVLQGVLRLMGQDFMVCNEEVYWSVRSSPKNSKF